MMIKDSNMSNNLNEIPSRGIGIKLISKIADKLNYTRTGDHRNCLLIVKYFHPGIIPPQQTNKSGNWQRAVGFFNRLNFGFQTGQNRNFYRSYNQRIKTIHLQLNTDLKSVTQVLWWVEQFFFRVSTHSRSSFAAVQTCYDRRVYKCCSPRPQKSAL